MKFKQCVNCDKRFMQTIKRRLLCQECFIIATIEECAEIYISPNIIMNSTKKESNHE